MNTTKGSFARVKSLSSFSVTRFPSPRQFHTIRLMDSSRATQQPPPLNLMKLRLPTLAFIYRGSLRWMPCTCSLFSFFPSQECLVKITWAQPRQIVLWIELSEQILWFMSFLSVGFTIEACKPLSTFAVFPNNTINVIFWGCFYFQIHCFLPI